MFTSLFVFPLASQFVPSFITFLADASVGPDTSTHITRSSGKVASSWAGSNRDNRVLVTLEHQLGVAGARIPELNSTVLGAGHDPLSIRGKGNAENKVL